MFVLGVAMCRPLNDFVMIWSEPTPRFPSLGIITTIVVPRVVKKTVFFHFVFFSEKKTCFFRVFFVFSVFFLASDFFIFKDLTYNYCKLMMLFKTQTFLFD